LGRIVNVNVPEIDLAILIANSQHLE